MWIIGSQLSVRCTRPASYLQKPHRHDPRDDWRFPWASVPSVFDDVFVFCHICSFVRFEPLEFGVHSPSDKYCPLRTLNSQELSLFEWSWRIAFWTLKLQWFIQQFVEVVRQWWHKIRNYLHFIDFNHAARFAPRICCCCCGTFFKATHACLPI